jgi:hypothetical protein
MKELEDYSRDYVPKIEDLSKACLEFSFPTGIRPAIASVPSEDVKRRSNKELQ